LAAYHVSKTALSVSKYENMAYGSGIVSGRNQRRQAMPGIKKIAAAERRRRRWRRNAESIWRLALVAAWRRLISGALWHAMKAIRKRYWRRRRRRWRNVK
jgi:hypothetical protein